VIRSGSTTFGTELVLGPEEEDTETGISGWNDGGAASSPRPPSILSVVAVTLPPFRCRSHMISRRFSCGNIWDICSTCAAVKRWPALRPEVPELLLLRDRNQYRIRKIERKATKAREGSERVSSSSSDDAISEGVRRNRLLLLISVFRSEFGNRIRAR